METIRYPLPWSRHFCVDDVFRFPVWWDMWSLEGNLAKLFKAYNSGQICFEIWVGSLRIASLRPIRARISNSIPSPSKFLYIMDARVKHEINDSHIHLWSWWLGLPKLAGFRLGKYLRKGKRLQVKIKVKYVIGASELQKIGNGQIANNFGIQDGYIFTLTSLGLRLDTRRHFSGVNLGPLGGLGIG